MAETGRRGIAGAMLASAAGLAILISLGVWQLHRREWKHRLLDQIARAETSAPVPLQGTNPPPFARLVLRGTWRPDAVAFYGADVRDVAGRPTMMAGLLQILERPGEPPVLIDRGAVPVDPAPLPATGPAEIIGYARPAEHAGLLSATDDIAGRRFYTLDPAAIGTALRTALPPFTVVALSDSTACTRDCPIPAESLPRPPDNHLNYALTWFGLAFSLCLVAGAYLRGQLRARPPG